MPQTHDTSATVISNSVPVLRQHYRTYNLSWWPVLVFLPARMLFAFLSQALTAVLFAWKGSSTPMLDAAGWWLVYSTFTDILCFLCLALLLNRERLAFRDLLGVKQNIAKHARYAFLYIVSVLPASALASFITRSYYGSQLPPMITIVHLPIGAALYGLFVWPIIWVIAEQFVYLGYLLPRLEAFTGKTWLAGFLVAFFWALQHLVIPFINDEVYLLSRVLSAFAATGGFTLVYILMKRQLVAAIAAHWLADTSTAFIAVILPLFK